MKINKNPILLLWLLFVICQISNLSAQKQNINFITFPNKEDIINQGINCLFVDSYGFLWLGTEHGLFSFDGYKFTRFDDELINQNVGKIGFVYALLEDENSNLWIGTSKGLFKLNLTTYQLKEYLFDESNKSGISGNSIQSLYLDKQQNFWIATENGLCCYNYKEDEFKQYLNHVTKGTIVGKEILTIEEDKSGNLWLGTWSAGLIKFNIKTGKYSQYDLEFTKHIIGNEKVIRTIKCIDENTLWIGNAQKGLISFNTKTSEINDSFFQQNKAYLQQGSICFYIDSKKRLWLAQNDYIKLFVGSGQNYNYVPITETTKNQALLYQPYSFYEDKNQGIWALTRFELLVYAHPAANDFTKFLVSLPKEKVSDNVYIRSFVIDKSKNLWIATYDKGLFKLDHKTGKYSSFLKDKTRIISHLFLSKAGTLWVSTNTGLYTIDIENDKIRPFSLAKNQQFSNNVLFVYQDSRSNYWIVNEEGVDCYNFETGFSKKYTAKNLQGLISFKIGSLIEDNDNNIWIGTVEGLNKIDGKTGKIKHYFYEAGNKRSLPNSFILTFGLYLDNDGKLWVSTQTGICSYYKPSDSFERFDINGAPKILTKKDVILWVSNNGNLIKYNTLTKKIITYSKFDGININPFGLYDPDNECIYVGGRFSDFYRIATNEIKVNLIKPEVYITGFFLFNKQLKVSSDAEVTPLKQNIIATKEITLLYNQNSVGFEFTTNNYLLPEKNEYAYKLEGVDKDWIYTDYKRRFTTYGNLSPGTYTFRVKASNNDGIWNETGTSIKIDILPPWWKTWFAYLVYFIGLFLSILYARKLTLKQAHLRNSLRMEHIMREKETEIHELKTRFFTNVSHEFRTPLTLLSGPVSKLISMAKEKAWDEEVMNYYLLMQRNIKRLAELTNQLLDLRKLESRNMRLEIYQGDIIPLLRNITSGFDELAKKKNISFQFICNQEEILAWIDIDKIEKIFNNLLSNAFKFTKEKDEITINVTTISINTGSYVAITISDTGAGIPTDKLNKIFDRFYQVDKTTTRKTEGTGIGLALVKELVQLYQGEVTVESIIDKGTQFKVLLPLRIEQLKEYILLSNVDAEMKSSLQIPDMIVDYELQQTSDKDESGIIVKSNKAVILIVEDNADMRFYIKNILKSHYKILEASNGLEGYKIAIQNLPDVIISDITMPEMDGNELARTIKMDDRTNHISVILLTALASTDSRLRGLTTGADDYITKPFNEEILQIKIKNLLDNRLKQQEHLIKEWNKNTGRTPDVFPKELEMPDLNEKFIEKALDIVERNMSNSEFGINILASDLNMHSYTLYRKFNSILNMNPSDFIRDIRMKRAFQLLANKQLSVSEVAFMVGFNDPKYFGKVFKKQFGKSPTDNIHRRL